MRFLIAHNHYQQAGGEDRVFQAEGSLLEANGHEVLRYAVHNSAIGERPSLVKLAAGTFWNHPSYSRFREILVSFRPDAVHVHNTLPLLSPAIYYAAASVGVPVVQTLHNFRLICPGALLYRDGRVCEECVGRRVAVPGVLHGCYRQSHAATLAVAGMVALHRTIGTWQNSIHAYIATTEFARGKLIAGGVPADRIVAKPNFIDPDPGVGTHDEGFALFVGRIAAEKGIPVLLEAWARLGARLPLRIAGDGPLFPGQGRDEARNVEWLGRRSTAEVLNLMKRARLLVVPSTWYEGFPVTLAEAFATGLPVVASNLGSLGEIVEDRVNGLHFRPGDSDDLVRAVTHALDHPEEAATLGARAREDFERKYTAAVNYRMLMGVYSAVIARRPVGGTLDSLVSRPGPAI